MVHYLLIKESFELVTSWIFQNCPWWFLTQYYAPNNDLCTNSFDFYCSLLTDMMNQVSLYNISYIPILDNYPDYANVTKIPLAEEMYTLVSGTMEKGNKKLVFAWFLLLLIFFHSAYSFCKKPCQQVTYTMGRDIYYDRKTHIVNKSNSSKSGVIVNFERNWAFEFVSSLS